MSSDLAEQITPFITEQLTALGLDYEAYGPYVIPLLENREDDDEWDSILELLQASSETYSDNETVWKQLKTDLQRRWKELSDNKEQEEETRNAQAEKEYQIQLEKEREASRLAQIEREEREAEAREKAKETDDVKKALVARFGYEDDEDGGEGNGEDIASNREVAAQATLDKARENRSQHVQSKKEEQKKTAQAKVAKAQAKEDRRKRATKGERKR